MTSSSLILIAGAGVVLALLVGLVIYALSSNKDVNTPES